MRLNKAPVCHITTSCLAQGFPDCVMLPANGRERIFSCVFYILGLTSEHAFTIIWERGFTNAQEAHRAKDTKEEILAKALELFSQNGYTGTNIRELTRHNDPAMLAFAYTTPISALIHLCDREPEKAGEAMTQIEAFSRHFIKTYGVMKNE